MLVFAVVYASLFVTISSTSSLKMRNITIVPDVYFDHLEALTQDRVYDRFNVLINSLLRDKCMTVWIYSPLKKRSIQMTESNLIDFLNAEMAVYSGMDENEFLEFSSKLPTNNNNTEQTLIYVQNYFYVFNAENIKISYL